MPRCTFFTAYIFLSCALRAHTARWLLCPSPPMAPYFIFSVDSQHLVLHFLLAVECNPPTYCGKQ